MNNDFIGNEFHKSRRHDLMREAEGGWRLKAAGVDKPGRSTGVDKPGRAIGMLALKAIGALIAILLIAQGLAR